MVGVGGVDQRQLVRGLCLVDGLLATLEVDNISQLTLGQLTINRLESFISQVTQYTITYLGL